MRLDLEILQAHFSVTKFHVRSRLPHFPELSRQVKKHDLLFGRFASWHTFWHVLFFHRAHKTSILVTGGYDLAKLPEIAYGSQRGGIRRWVTNTTLRLATVLVTNSHFSVCEAVNHAGVPASKLHLIPDGIPDPFGDLSARSGSPIVLTVGNVEKDNLLRKGHLPFAQAAALLPDTSFILVGRDRDGSAEKLQAIAPANLLVTGWLSQEALLEHYARAWVYVQPSLHESFGVSVAEAMLAGCIPVVSAHGALPEVVGDAGIVLSSTEPVEVARGIQQALQCSVEDRQRARQRILDEFPLEKRSKVLVELCKKTFSM